MRSAELQRPTVAAVITVLILISVVSGKVHRRTGHEGPEKE